MTHSSTNFDTYKTRLGNQKVTVAYGSPITVAGQGDIKLTPSRPLQLSCIPLNYLPT